MVKEVRQIEQEIGAIEETVNSVAQELRQVYEQYLKRLGQTVKQQLVLVSYQICTKTYPEAFVKLSYSQREKLQQSLQQLAKGATALLLQCLEESPGEVDSEENSEGVTIPELDVSQPFAGAELPPAIETDAASEAMNPNEPQALMQWYQDTESAIALALEDLSCQANTLLQQAGVLPDIPPKLLEIAMQAEEVTSMGTPNTPNLLNLLIEEKEKSQEEDDEDRAVTQLAVIRLRLNDLEFADPVLSIERKKIRDRVNRLTSMQKSYRKKQQEKVIAQADAAWRSSWYESE
jgi:hypothetical protein